MCSGSCGRTIRRSSRSTLRSTWATPTWPRENGRQRFRTLMKRSVWMVRTLSGTRHVVGRMFISRSGTTPSPTSTRPLRCSRATPGSTPSASARRQKGEPALAIEDFNQAIQLKPNDFGSIYQRGEIYLRLGNGEKALADFDASVKLNPGDAWARMARAQARRVTGDLAGSIEDCDEAIRLKPGIWFYHLQRGFTYQAREDWRRAVADFDKAIELGDEAADVYEARAVARAKLNDAAGARDDEERAARLRPPAQSKPGP